MTKWIYYRDCYCREFDAVVTDVGELGVVLDRSAFYPGGGGQPSDQGFLVDASGHRYQVASLKREEGKFFHRIEGELRPAVGDKVHGVLDWDRRYLLMRTHTAMHMMSGVVWNLYDAQVTGGNMEPGQGRLDFELSDLFAERVHEIENRINAEVAAGRPIDIYELPREQAFLIPDLIRTKVNLLPASIAMIRIVDIKGLDLQADGGTHVRDTREVGPVKVLKYTSKGKGNKRIYLGLDPDFRLED